ncbi:MAG: RiPP maturation radical SAM C-methyltransferase [Chitinivibrionales bacterium]|nr:RiPP maturation radical SAM C-methyltransferase [Chitinivibrionales bacterium]
MARVLILNMPFVSLSRPAIGVSLLKARCREEGITCDIGYANILFAEIVGVEDYILIDSTISLALFPGDWLFAQYAFGQRLDLNTYCKTLEQNCGGPQNYQRVLQMRYTIEPFIERCFQHWDFQSYDIIGFTTTFQQNMASIVFAGYLKKKFPEKTIVFGGGNCEGEMGLQLHASFPWIDYVCSGEADYSFPQLVHCIENKLPVAAIAGLIYRDITNDRSIRTSADTLVEKLDNLPDPDFSDYFAAVAPSSIASHINPTLEIQCSRGCWWGAQSHCTFCGLNGEGMHFRFKSSQRVLDEIQRQSTRYNIRSFQAVDNVICREYFDTLLPLLQKRCPGVTFFWEIRPTITKQEISQLKEAGVVAVQPGIESLSTSILKLMRKGVTALQNIQLLKWCREYGIEVAWNLLYGFPGESAAEYEQVLSLIDAIPHLRPPGGAKPMRLDRFSPYFKAPSSYGITSIHPFSMYRFVYPLPDEAIYNIAYFFEFTYTDGTDPQTYIEPVIEKVEAWMQPNAGTLIKQHSPEHEMILIDSRGREKPVGFPLRGLQAEIYEYCDEVRSFESIIAFVRKRSGDQQNNEVSIMAFLGEMVKNRLMVREGKRFLSIALTQRLPS